MIRILVTGAGGFIGKRLTSFLDFAGYPVRATIRDEQGQPLPAGEIVKLGNIGNVLNWSSVVDNIDAVIHLAARAHVTAAAQKNSLEAFRAINLRPTMSLFKACQRAGVARFVFVSSIGVNGVVTATSPFRESDLPRPVEPYAVSKWETEQALRSLTTTSSTELVIVRPALTYGPGAKGNFLRLMSLIDQGWPIPFGSLSAKRSFLGVTGLCDLLLRCAEHPRASNQLFLAADSPSISTKQLILALSDLLHRRSRMIRVPIPILKTLAACTGRSSDMGRLLGSLEVDSSKAKTLLGWQATMAIDSDLKEMAAAYMTSKGSK